MLVPGSVNPVLGSSRGSLISRSLRFNSADSSYLFRTFGTPTTQATFTFSAWAKRSSLGAAQQLFGVSTNHSFGFTTGNALNLTFGGVSALTTTAVFRDPTAWYHIVWRQSGTSHTIYVNNVVVGTATATSSVFNTAVTHQIGAANTTNFFQGYLTEVYFIDGQALTPTNFGATDSNGEWQPIDYFSPTGANGFKLNFSDNSATTATTLGKDQLGSNNWTPVNFIVYFLPATTFVTVGTTNASGGTIANGGTPFWVDVVPSNADLAYSGAMSNVHDSSLSTFTYWTGNEITNQGDVLQARLDLRSFSTISSVRIYARGLGSPYIDYTARLLDASKVAIGGTTITISPTSAQWITVPVAGTPRYLEFSTTSGINRRVELYAIEVNGVQLVNGISLSDSDSTIDSPTSYGSDSGLGGEARGNYAVLNTQNNPGLSTLTNGGLQCAIPSTSSGRVLATIAVSSDKWYWEVTCVSGSDFIHGVAKVSDFSTGYIGQTSTSYGYFATTGAKYVNGSSAAYGATYGLGDIIGVALDLDVGTLTFYKNGVSQGTAFTGLTGVFYPGLSRGGLGTTATMVVNFGQSPWSYAAPSGFKALCDTNLPTPVVLKPDALMDVVPYTGNGTSQTISGLAFSPDLVWIKSRSQTYIHSLLDTIRGGNARLSSNTTDPENTGSAGGATPLISSFNSDGFTLPNNNLNTNSNTVTYTAWCWDLGATAGFDIVTYTGTGANRTVSHSLGVAPSLIFVKQRTAASATNWAVWHSSLAATQYLLLNTTAAAATGATYWNSTLPTNTVFSLGTSSDVNTTSGTYVAYLWAPVSSYSSFGIYTGNGLADGPYVHCDFRPKWVLIKQTTSGSTTTWYIFDSERLGYNGANYGLFPNTGAIESSTNYLDLTSTGFKLLTTDGSLNASANTYVYAAFAESPFKYSRAR